jgi:integrase
VSEISTITSLRLRLADLVNEARQYAGASHASNTQKGYDSDWRDFESWCVALELPCRPASAETVALYLTHLARSHKTSTLHRRLAAISHVHQRGGQPTPTNSLEVRAVLAGIRRQKGTAPKRKRPLLGSAIAKAAGKLPDNEPIGLRNRALLLLGYAGALRRSELVALDWEDCEFETEGLRLRIRKSKTDPTGQGSFIGIPQGSNSATCPVQALLALREYSGIRSGPIFRTIGRSGKTSDQRLSPKAVARLVKNVARSLGLNPDEFSAHSLRAGLATTAARNGASERKIMDQTRHRSLKTARTYIRDGELFRENAASKADL